MKQEHLNTNKQSWLLKLSIMYSNRMLSKGRPLQSLKSISWVIFVFAVLFILALVVKALMFNPASMAHFKLLTSGIDISPIFSANKTAFFISVLFEAIRFAVFSMLIFYFSRFLGSLDNVDPFKNPVSKDYIIRVSFLSAIFFSVDFLGSLHLSNYQDLLAQGTRVTLFHVEFLVLAYFINVFALIYKKGADLKEEIDLVI